MGENKFFNILLTSLGVLALTFVAILIVGDLFVPIKKANISFSSSQSKNESDFYFDVELNSKDVEYGKDFSFKVNFEEITEENGYMVGVGSEYKYENLTVMANGKEYSSDDGNFTIPEVKEDTEIKVVYPLVNFVVNGLSKKILLNKGENVYSALQERTQLTDEITCGLYLDEDYLVALDEQEKAKSELTVYTAMATPGYIQFSEEGEFVNIGNISSTKENNVVVPKKHWGKLVYRVESFYEAMANRVVLPSSIKSFGSGAFAYTTIKSINIPIDVDDLGIGAFSHSSFEEIKFHEDSKITSFSMDCFYDCGRLTSITIPKNITYIDETAFTNCVKLVEITNLSDYEFKPFNEYEGGLNYVVNERKSLAEPSILIDYDGVRYYQYDTGLAALMLLDTTKTDLTLHDNCLSIHEEAFFKETSLETIKLPYALRKINKYAFSMCANLTSVIIPPQVVKIDDRAFQGCLNLTSLTFEEESKLKEIGEYAFYGSLLTNIVFPNQLERIGSYAFNASAVNKSIYIPDSVNFIGKLCFDASFISNIQFKATTNWCLINSTTGDEVEVSKGDMMKTAAVCYLMDMHLEYDFVRKVF